MLFELSFFLKIVCGASYKPFYNLLGAFQTRFPNSEFYLFFWFFTITKSQIYLGKMESFWYFFDFWQTLLHMKESRVLVCKKVVFSSLWRNVLYSCGLQITQLCPSGVCFKCEALEHTGQIWTSIQARFSLKFNQTILNFYSYTTYPLLHKLIHFCPRSLSCTNCNANKLKIATRTVHVKNNYLNF